MAEPKVYEYGPRQGQVIQEYPKMLYRGTFGVDETTLAVRDEQEHAEARKQGWGKRSTAEPEQAPAEQPTEGEADTGQGVRRRRG